MIRPRLALLAVPIALAALLLAPASWSATGEEVQQRIDADVAKGQAIVVHVVVALCDNANQGIVPVPKALGNGQNPRSNLYWGALYGVRTHFAKSWGKLDTSASEDSRILERVAFQTSVSRGGKPVDVIVVADAWDGRSIRGAIEAFAAMAAGRDELELTVSKGAERSYRVRAGGAAHLVAYVGHNGLMEFSVDKPKHARDKPPRSTLALACVSKSDFVPLSESPIAHPLLMTTNFMAPEAYTLDAAIRSWAAGEASSTVVESAAQAYHDYQQCGINGARRLFWGAP